MAGINALKRGKNMYQLIVNYNIIYCFLIVICRMFLGRFIDDQGIGYLAVPMELYLIAAYAFSMPLAKTISGLMKVRIKREQYRNAVKVARCGYLMVLLPAALLGMLYLISCRNLASAFRVELSWMALSAAAFAVFFVIISGAPKGFLMGAASKSVSLIGQILETVLSIAGMVIGAKIGTKYGSKAGALLKNENMVYGYGAFGVMAGLALGCFIAWILWMVLYMIFRNVISAKIREDSNRRTEDTRTCFGMILNNMMPITVTALLTQGIVLLLVWIFVHHPGTEEGIERSIAYLGCFYGKYLPLMMIPMALCAYQMVLHNSKIASSYEREEGRQLRDRLEKGIIKLNAISVSGAVFVAVLGQAFAEVFFTGMTTSVLKLIGTTSVLIVCYSYFYAGHSLLQKMQYHGESLMMMASAFSVGAIASYLILVKMQKGLTGVVVSLILFYLIGAVAAAARIYFLTRCNLNLVRCFGLPVLAAAVSGIIILFLNRLLLETAGAVVTLLVGVFLGILIDIMLLMALHVVTENQIRNIPGGFILVHIGKGIGLI